MSTSEIILRYVCPSLGCLMASIMFAAPVQDLRRSLRKGSLGSLNPFPWVMMTGNCLGWTVYGYYTRDPFVVAANMPGLVLSLWLNSSAAKLQYYQLMREQRMHREHQWDADAAASSPHLDPEDTGSVEGDHDAPLISHDEFLVMVPQERSLLRILSLWVVVLVYVGWFTRLNPATLVGLVVNINLVFFYGAPLQAARAVIREGNSSAIHVPTMVMNWLNTSFWIAYGLTRHDVIIIAPNSIGLSLGILQGLLRLVYPASNAAVTTHHSLVQPHDEEEDCGDLSPEDDVPPVSQPHRLAVTREVI